MFFAFRKYLHLVRHYLLVRPERTPIGRIRRRFLLLLPLIELPTFICLLLDHLFFPSHRRLAIRQPVFVIGNPRSGTTLFHRLLSHDQEHFHSFRTWEILFPSILQQRVIAGLGRRDARRGGTLRRRIEAFEARRLGSFAKIHQIGLFLPEEDGKLLLHVLASPDLTWFFPPEEFGPLTRFDREIAPGLQQRILAFYAGCIRRHASVWGRDRQLLSKNPFFTGKIRALRQAFPDCRFVCLVRNPLETIPSTINMTRTIMKIPVGPNEMLDRAIYAQLKDYYLYALEQLSDMPAERCAFVTYDELVRAPDQVVTELYRRFGLDISPAFAAQLTAETCAVRERQSAHRYSLADTAITQAEILADLKPIFDRFGFQTK